MRPSAFYAALSAASISLLFALSIAGVYWSSPGASVIDGLRAIPGLLFAGSLAGLGVGAVAGLVVEAYRVWEDIKAEREL